MERKILRKIFGPVKDEETAEWRIRKNKELEDLFQEPNILDTIQSRLQWAGHAGVVRRLGSPEPSFRIIFDLQLFIVRYSTYIN